MFEDVANNIGWTENWFTSAADIVAASAIAHYAVVRLATMVDTSWLRAIRFSNVDPPRDSLYIDLTGPLVPTLHGAFDHTTFPQCGYDEALLVRRDTDDNDAFGHQFLHAVPAAIFTGRAYPSAALPAGWNAAFAALHTEVLNGNYLIRRKVAGVYGYIVCSQYIALRKTTHRVGRPFDGLRGKRRIA